MVQSLKRPSRGTRIVELWASYAQGTTSTKDIDQWLSLIYPELGYPDWLVMLSRNCEYATDVEYFIEPFQKEFRYIAELWSQSGTIEEFHARDDRDVSRSHDFHQ